MAEIKSVSNSFQVRHQMNQVITCSPPVIQSFKTSNELFFCSKKLAWCENYFLKSYQRGQLAEWCTVYETPVVKKKVSSVFNHSFQAINHIIEWSLQGRGQGKKKKKKKGPTQHNILHQEVQQPLQQQPSISKETKMETPRVKRGNFPTIHPFSIHPLVLSIVSRG